VTRGVENRKFAKAITAIRFLDLLVLYLQAGLALVGLHSYERLPCHHD